MSWIIVDFNADGTVTYIEPSALKLAMKICMKGCVNFWLWI